MDNDEGISLLGGAERSDGTNGRLPVLITKTKRPNATKRVLEVMHDVFGYKLERPKGNWWTPRGLDLNLQNATFAGRSAEIDLWEQGGKHHPMTRTITEDEYVRNQSALEKALIAIDRKWTGKVEYKTICVLWQKVCDGEKIKPLAKTAKKNAQQANNVAIFTAERQQRDAAEEAVAIDTRKKMSKWSNKLEGVKSAFQLSEAHILRSCAEKQEAAKKAFDTLADLAAAMKAEEPRMAARSEFIEFREKVYHFQLEICGKHSTLDWAAEFNESNPRFENTPVEAEMDPSQPSVDENNSQESVTLENDVPEVRIVKKRDGTYGNRKAAFDGLRRARAELMKVARKTSNGIKQQELAKKRDEGIAPAPLADASSRMNVDFGNGTDRVDESDVRKSKDYKFAFLYALSFEKRDGTRVVDVGGTSIVTENQNNRDTIEKIVKQLVDNGFVNLTLEDGGEGSDDANMVVD